MRQRVKKHTIDSIAKYNRGSKHTDPSAEHDITLLQTRYSSSKVHKYVHERHLNPEKRFVDFVGEGSNMSTLSTKMNAWRTGRSTVRSTEEDFEFRGAQEEMNKPSDPNIRQDDEGWWRLLDQRQSGTTKWQLNIRTADEESDQDVDDEEMEDAVETEDAVDFEMWDDDGESEDVEMVEIEPIDADHTPDASRATRVLETRHIEALETRAMKAEAMEANDVLFL